MLSAALSRNHRSYRSYRTYSGKKAQALHCAIKLFEIEGFAEIDVAARFQRGFFHAVNVVRGDGDYWCMAALTFEPAIVSDGLQTIKNRHVQVDDEQARPDTPGYIKCLPTVFG